MAIQERHEPSGGPEKTTKMIRGKGGLASEDRMRQLWLFSLEKAPERRFAAFQYWKGPVKHGNRLFSKARSYRTTGDDFKLKEGQFRLDITNFLE